MDEEAIKEFSALLNQKLRHVKLAISKANLGQNKYKPENDAHLLELMEKKNALENKLNKHHLNRAIFSEAF